MPWWSTVSNAFLKSTKKEHYVVNTQTDKYSIAIADKSFLAGITAREKQIAKCILDCWFWETEQGIV